MNVPYFVGEEDQGWNSVFDSFLLKGMSFLSGRYLGICTIWVISIGEEIRKFGKNGAIDGWIISPISVFLSIPEKNKSCRGGLIADE